MDIYDAAEQKRVKDSEDSREKMEIFCKTKRDEWSKNITPLFATLTSANFSRENYNRVIETQANALSYLQVLNEEIALFLNKRSKEEIKLKRLKQDKFLFYSTGFPLKTNSGEKAILMDGNIGVNEAIIEIMDVHIEFLRECCKNLQNLQYSIKNIISLIEYVGK